MPDTSAQLYITARPADAAGSLAPRGPVATEEAEPAPGDNLHMDELLLEQYIRQYSAAQTGDVLTLAWQGGEPAAMGVDFYRRAAAFARQYARPGMAVEHTICTGGALLDDEWCTFLRDNDFLVGLRIDGPHSLHDAGCLAAEGAPPLRSILAAVRRLRKHHTPFSVFTPVHAANAAHPLRVYRFLRDKVGCEWVQFTPLVEWNTNPGGAPGRALSERSVTAQQWGAFLCTVYDEWVRHDVGRIYINLFEAALAAWLGAPPPLCILAETCGGALALEPNGDLYSCERFVAPQHLLGNIRQQPLRELIAAPQQQAFGAAKRDGLPQQCRTCPFCFACHGECPKNRYWAGDAGEEGLNCLCEGYLRFFTHIDRTMRIMAQLQRMGRAPAEVMPILAEEDAHWRIAAAALGRNAACPCGSGLQVKACHGQSKSV